MLFTSFLVLGISLVGDAWCVPLHGTSRWTHLQTSTAHGDVETQDQVHLSSPSASGTDDDSAHTPKLVPVLVYTPPPGSMSGRRSENTSLLGFASTEEEFAVFVQYMMGDNASLWSPALVSNRTVDPTAKAVQTEFLSHWAEGNLLVSQSSEWNKHVVGEGSFASRLNGLVGRIRLFYYGTGNNEEEDAASPDDASVPQETKVATDLLALLEDEFPNEWAFLSHPPRAGPSPGLGARARTVAFDPKRTEAESLECLKLFLVWFKQAYPYYYSACTACGNKDGKYVGMVVASEDEKAHFAGRTELVTCEACGATTRFPRFNDIEKILMESRRGRCGEYSVAALALLEALGWQARWVVDWADHVWVEVLVPCSAASCDDGPDKGSGEGHTAAAGEGGGGGTATASGRWVHCDPCEAAVDEPLIYEGWGKNATFIFAFDRENIVDVTNTYTSNATAARARRSEDAGSIEKAVLEAIADLRDE